MRRLVYFVACTADGFIAREDGSADFFPMTGDHLLHIAAHFPDTIPGHARELMGVSGERAQSGGGDRSAVGAAFDTVLMGRRTYEVGTAVGVTSPYPHLEQYVVSRSLEASPDPDVRLVSGGPVELVRELKRRSGLDIWLCGGASLASALYDEIDEVILKINPVLLGSGMPLFAGARGVRSLELTAHQAFAGGVAIHRYRVAGTA